MNSGKSATAGPGHNPPTPHPAPKMQAPAINLKSIVVLVGTSNLVFQNGYFLNLKVIKLIPTAEIITNINEANTLNILNYGPN